MTDEVSFSESIRQVLAVERKLEGGCEVLIDKEQSLIRKGMLKLHQVIVIQSSEPCSMSDSISTV